jgi:TonB-linked SusC/RagA family outer membrane protein
MFAASSSIFKKNIYPMKNKFKFFKNLTKVSSWKALVVFSCILLSSASIFGQDRTVSGTIKDANGSSLPGALVRVKGTAIATSTDANGSFTLAVPEAMKDSTLSISFIGYTPVETKMAGKTAFNQVLEASSKSLNEVIVVGYGTQKKSDLTGAVSSISAADIQKAPVLEVGQAIQGRMAGVQVIPSTGSPGADVNIRVRGTATVGNSNPLYVVDGVPMADFGLSAVNPVDIESIEVLKDASACAIYGSRGASGVVLVTTKKGKAGKTIIQFDAYTGTQSAWKKMNLLHADQWAMLNNEAALADGKELNPKFANPAALGVGTDWQDQIFRVAPLSSYNLSASGGADKSTFYVSANYFKQDGIIKKTDAERMSFRLNASQQMTSKFKTGQFLNIMRFKKNSINEDNEFTSVINAALTMDPTTPVKNPDGSFAASSNNNINNPVALLDNSNNTWVNNRMIGAFFGEYEFIEGLKFKSNLGMDASFGNYNGFSPTFYVSPSFQSSTNTVSRYSEQRLSSVWDNTVTYSKKLNENHEFTALAGISAQSTSVESISASKGGVQSNDPNLRYLDAATVNASASGNLVSTGLLSYLGRVNYTFKNKYLLTANLRVDGSSRFLASNRWGVFPSISAGWKISQEEFMKKFPVISTLKLRVGWGQLGNQNLYGVNSAYPYTTVVSPGQNYTFGADKSLTPGSTQLSLGNSQVKWETVTQTNFGIDGGLFDDKISFVVDFYIKKTSGMLVQVPVQTYLGLQIPPYVNAGEVLNRGLELALQYKKSEGQFHYSAGFNISFLHNEVLSLGNGDPIPSANFANLGNVSRTEVGQPIASFYGYKTAGIFQNAAEVNASAQKNAKPGDIRFVDTNGDGVIDDRDRTFIGSPMPDFTYGINLGASYKGFDLSIFFQGVQGNKIFNGNKFFLESGVGYTNMSNSMLNRWTGEGSSNETPRMTQTDPNNNHKLISDRYVEDGSYLRIKTMQLGYTLPVSVVKYARIEKIRIYVAAQNLFTMTKYKGLDPEVGILGGSNGNVLDIGIDRGAYPQARTFTIGANLTF